MKRLALASALWAGLSGAAAAECRLALVLALDVSGSVDGVEYRLQLDGLAAALTHPEVAAAAFAAPGNPVAISIFEWSGPAEQRVLVPWVEVAGPAELAAAADRLRATSRRPAEPSTAIGSAMFYGQAVLGSAPPCWRQAIDVSGDGKSNTGPHPGDVFVAPGVTINALAIGGELMDPGELRHVSLAELSAYFRAYVIRGPEAFVETAANFREFEDAMIRKLKREMMVLNFSAPGTRAPDAAMPGQPPAGASVVPASRPAPRLSPWKPGEAAEAEPAGRQPGAARAPSPPTGG
ncbi:DUF1194 domain-containing protein [Oceanicola sp. 22II-s10i]|uniref:DUF1194 domain-containing protein n=1 Tax=Oceanicola sp. 22II-s10i TaxID=1317116 RepID=UPI000B526B80